MKNDRYIKVEVVCEICSKKFLARRTRVRDGLSRFCSKECFDIEQRNRAKKLWGRKDLAKTYKVGKTYTARWYDENGKAKSTSFARWWWEMNIGEIPSGMVILHKDNNPLNIEPSNFEIGTRSDALKKGNKTRKKDPKKYADYTNKLRKKQKKMWDDGKFDHIKGSGNYKWNGGHKSGWKEYPKEFFEIRDSVLSRDGYICQICARDLSKKSGVAIVHHINGDKNNNTYENLISLCRSCHSKIHATKRSSPTITAFRSMLNS